LIRAEEHLGLVMSVLMRVNYGMYNRDLYQEGVVGLLRAIRQFDPKKGYAFSTYAAKYIEGYIRTYRWKDQIIRPTRTESGLKFAEIFDYEEIDLLPQNSENFWEKIDSQDSADRLLNFIKGKEGEVLRYCIVDRLSESAAGMKVGVCQEQAGRLKRRALSKLKVIAERYDLY
jgi:RNA polymerase sigma factor (sigma-70 family)